MDEHRSDMRIIPARSISASRTEISKAEINFLRYPIFNLSTKGLRQKTKIEYYEEIKRDGNTFSIHWKVTANSEHGFPGPFDRKVFRAIENMISKMGFPVSNPVPVGSLYKLSKILGINNSGKNKLAIKKSLIRLVVTSIESKGTFFSKDKMQWLEKAFHLYDSVVFLGEKLPEGKVAETNYIFLSEWYLNNLNSFYIRYIDYSYWCSLRNEISKRLYELLGLKFYNIKKGEYRNYLYSTLTEVLPVTRRKYFADVKQQLFPAFDELIKTRFLERVEHEESSKDNDWLFYFYPGVRIFEQRILPESEEQDLLQTSTSNQALTGMIYADSEDVCMELISLFYRKLHGLRGDYHHRNPSKNELEYARQLLDEHGKQAVEELIDFSLEEAKRTDFKPRSLMILSLYLPQYLAYKQNLEDLKQKREQLVERDRALELYEQEVQMAVLAEFHRRYSPHEQKELIAKKVESFMKLSPQSRPAGDIKQYAKKALLKELRESLDLPSFENWLKDREKG